MIILNISNRIRTLRSEKKLSQGKLAQALGVSRQAVSKWENGSSVPDMENLIQLCELFEVDISYLTIGISKPAENTAPSLQPISPPPQVVVNLVEKTDRIIERVVEKPVIRKVTRIKYLRNPFEFSLIALAGFLLGFLIGKLL